MARKEPTIDISRLTIETLDLLVFLGKRDGLDAKAFHGESRTVGECLEGIAKALRTAYFNKHATQIHHYLP